MAYGDESFFDDEEIRDQVETKSPSLYVGAYIPKTVTIDNGLDAIIDYDIYGCRKSDTTTLYKITTVPVTVGAGETAYETLDAYFQCFFLYITAQSTPTSGGVTAHMLVTSGD